jgi:hypothetical protein
VLLYRLHILSALMSGGRTVVAAKINESGEEVFGGVAVWFPPNEALNIWNIRRMAKAGMFKLLKGWGIFSFFVRLLEAYRCSVFELTTNPSGPSASWRIRRSV